MWKILNYILYIVNTFYIVTILYIIYLKQVKSFYLLLILYNTGNKNYNELKMLIDNVYFTSKKLFRNKYWNLLNSL